MPVRVRVLMTAMMRLVLEAVWGVAQRIVPVHCETHHDLTVDLISVYRMHNRAN